MPSARRSWAKCCGACWCRRASRRIPHRRAARAAGAALSHAAHLQRRRRQRRRARAARRRHRHHEHHADVGGRAHARDRRAPHRRRQAARHHDAVPDRDAADDGRRRRRRHRRRRARVGRDFAPTRAGRRTSRSTAVLLVSSCRSWSGWCSACIQPHRAVSNKARSTIASPFTEGFASHIVTLNTLGFEIPSRMLGIPNMCSTTTGDHALTVISPANTMQGTWEYPSNPG